jgi:hypothetical protein
VRSRRPAVPASCPSPRSATWEAEVVPAREQRTSGVAGYALDEANADRLWTVSNALLETVS